MNYKAQGALEYLLLLAAAVVVVAVVISFMIGTIKPIEDSSDKQTFDFICKTLKTKDLTCGCYLCDNSIGGATKVKCTNLSSFEDNPLLDPANSNHPLLSGYGQCPVGFT